MVTIVYGKGVSYSYKADGSVDVNQEATVYCLSSDTKPTTVPNSTPCYEMDTGDLYMFDVDNAVWLAQ